MAALSRLPDSERAYYQRLETIVDSEDFDEVDAGVFFSNFLDQVLKDGVKLVFNDVVGSRVVEKILKRCHTESESVLVILERLTENFGDICTHRYGSHALETFLLEIFLGKFEWQEGALRDKMEENFLTMCSLALENFTSLVKCPYGTHVLRCILQITSGLRISEDLLRSKMSAHFCSRKMPHSNDREHHSSDYVLYRRNVSSEIGLCLKRFGKKLCKLKPLEDYIMDQNASPVFQVAVIVMRQGAPERGGKLMNKIFKCIGKLKDEKELVPNSSMEAEDMTHLSAIFFDPIGSHMIDVLLEVLPPDLQEVLYTDHLRHHIMELALHPIANYILQHFITTATETQISMVMDELQLEDVLSAGHLGVVVRLSQSCGEFPSVQERFWGMLLAALHVNKQPKKCLPLLLSLTVYEDHYDTGENDMEDVSTSLPLSPLPVSLHGSLLVQNTLQYQDTKLVTSLLVGLPLPSLTHLACHPNGSHVLEAVLSSKMVDSRKKQKLVDKFKGTFPQLCCNKHGSRLVDACWRHSEVNTKREIAEELLLKEEDLKGDYYGKFVLRNCNIESFKRKQDAWQEKQKAVKKTVALFDDILKEDIGLKKKKTSHLKKRSHFGHQETGTHKMDDDDDTSDVFAHKNGKPKMKKIPLF